MPVGRTTLTCKKPTRTSKNGSSMTAACGKSITPTRRCTMTNRYLDAALNNLRLYLKKEREGYKRLRLLDIISDLELGIISADEAIEEAKMIGVRNPSFD